MDVVDLTLDSDDNLDLTMDSDNNLDLIMDSENDANKDLKLSENEFEFSDNEDETNEANFQVLFLLSYCFITIISDLEADDDDFKLSDSEINECCADDADFKVSDSEIDECYQTTCVSTDVYLAVYYCCIQIFISENKVL